MARRVKNKFRELKKKHPETYEGLVETFGMTTDKAYKKLKKDKVPKITTKKELRKIASEFEEKHDVDVNVTENLGEQKDADAIAVDKMKLEIEQEIRLHPILQYRDEKFIKDVLNHELDHVKVYKKRANKLSKRLKLKKPTPTVSKL